MFTGLDLRMMHRGVQLRGEWLREARARLTKEGQLLVDLSALAPDAKG